MRFSARQPRRHCVSTTTPALDLHLVCVCVSTQVISTSLAVGLILGFAVWTAGVHVFCGWRCCESAAEKKLRAMSSKLGLAATQSTNEILLETKLEMETRIQMEKGALDRTLGVFIAPEQDPVDRELKKKLSAVKLEANLNAFLTSW